MDLKYKNKEGISLQKVLDVISKNDELSKKDLSKKLKAKKSVDTLLNKLIDFNLIKKIKDGRSVVYTSQLDKAEEAEPELIESYSKKEVIKPPKMIIPPKKKSVEKPIKITKEPTTVNSEKVEDKKIEMAIDDKKEHSLEVNQDDLDHLKKVMEAREDKFITTILHTRNERKPKKTHDNVSKMYEQAKEEEKKLKKHIPKEAIKKLDYEEIIADEIAEENPYRFVLNFFTSTLNDEMSTPNFKRRDNYVVKSIYNKFKTLSEKVDDYNTEQQHIPFYRAFTIDKNTMTVKMYHIDMNRVIRGCHTLFKIDDEDKRFIFGGK